MVPTALIGPRQDFSNLSSVMVGLDPTIHAPGTAVDPRLKAEDDGGGEAGVLPIRGRCKAKTKEAAGAIRRLLS
ncbi:protein of unknown function [Shinella sp. WSC3-e]|nr:hypothetical protein SHINE37_44058 [Rhizobiaceae bacterium]CAK7258580.1 protein of unknown function [Shinella sp. WSC3-e]